MAQIARTGSAWFLHHHNVKYLRILVYLKEWKNVKNLDFNPTSWTAVDTLGVPHQYFSIHYVLFFPSTVDIDRLIRSQVSTGERGGCCRNRSGSHHGSSCQSDHHLLHHRRQRGRWVSSSLGSSVLLPEWSLLPGKVLPHTAAWTSPPPTHDLWPWNVRFPCFSTFKFLSLTKLEENRTEGLSSHCAAELKV